MRLTLEPTLTTLAQHFRVLLVPGPPIGVRGNGILLPNRPVRAILQRRR